MKQILISGGLIALLITFAVFGDFIFVKNCNDMIETLERESQRPDYSAVCDKWERFSHFATVFTGNDLIRATNNACATYLAAREDNPDSVDTKTTRASFIQALEELRSMHGFKLERLL